MDQETTPSKPLLPSGHECTSCGLCESVCAHQAIRMVENAEGFLEPQVDATLCIGCKACEKMCTKLASPTPSHTELEYYEAWLLDEEGRKRSSSGGVGTALARAILRRGGVVCGVECASLYGATFVLIEKEEDLGCICGTKYMQAYPDRIFAKIADCLKAGRMVLFTGTACQVKALRTRFGYKKPGLYAVDIACFGVPSRLLLRSCVAEWREEGRDVAAFCFRDKRESWLNYGASLTYSDGSARYIPHSANWFLNGFMTRLALNKSCYPCTYDETNRPGDLSIGDFWGRKEKDDIHAKLGVSFIIRRTPAGQELLDWAKGDLQLTPATLPDVLGGNGGIRPQPEPLPKHREDVLRRLATAKFTEVWAEMHRRGWYPPKKTVRIGKAIITIPRWASRAASLLQRVRRKLTGR